MFSKAYDISKQDKIIHISSLIVSFLFLFLLVSACFLGFQKVRRTFITNKTVQTIVRTALIISGNPQQFSQIGPLPLNSIFKEASGNTYQLNSGIILSAYVQADNTFMIQLQNVPYYVCENIVLSQAIPSFAYEGGKNLDISETPNLTEFCGTKKYSRTSFGLIFNKSLSSSEHKNLKSSLLKAFQKIPSNASLFLP